MTALINNLRSNQKAYDAMSSIDKTTLNVYNVRYCSCRENTIYIIVVSEVIDATMGSRWNRARKQCRDDGVFLDISIVTQEQYSKWVFHNVKKDPDAEERWLQRWYKVMDTEPKRGMWAKAADHIYYLKDIKNYRAIAPKILESGYFSMR